MTWKAFRSSSLAPKGNEKLFELINEGSSSQISLIIWIINNYNKVWKVYWI